MPRLGLVQANDGNFYGTTFAGGDSSGPCANNFGSVGCGTVFKIAPAGALTTLHSFDFTHGVQTTGLVQTTSGTFYGTTVGGGPNVGCIFGFSGTCGTVYSLSVGLGPFVETVPTAGSMGESVTILGTDLAKATHVFF